jgi:glycolate oxidase FAD binding subunit
VSAAADRRVLRPRDAADLAEIVAGEPGPFEILGGGSKRPIGRPVEADALELGALAGIIDYEPAELVLRARAATPLATIERELGAHGQRLAFEPPSFGALLGTHDRQTIGGVLAANLSGSRRVSAGAARDHFLGCTAVNGRGETFKAGGRVVKNVTGYDLPKVLAGSWGTLAAMTEVTVRVVPAPETERTLVATVANPGAAVALLTAALGSAHDVSAASFDPYRGALLRLEGFAASVDARAAALTADLGLRDAAALDGEASRAAWRSIAGAELLAPCACVWRISIPPSDAARVLAQLPTHRYLLDWGGGLVWLGADRADGAQVRAALGNGHATLWKAPLEQRAAATVFHPQPAVVAELARRLKASFDPAGKLNPGRLD